MGQSTFPVPSSGSSTSTVLPVNASSVILDGSLTSATSYTTTVNGNGGIAYLTATDNPATITISGTAYSVPANSVVATTAVVGSGVSATVSANYSAPSTPTAGSVPSNLAFRATATGTIGGTTYLVAVVYSSSTFLYSTNGTSWTSGTMPSVTTWNGVAFGNGYFVAVTSGGNGPAAYSTNGTTWTASTLSGSSPSCYSVAAGTISGTTYYIAPDPGAGTNYQRSTNGTSWSLQTYPVSAIGYIAFYNGRFMAVGEGYISATSTNASVYSTNGTTWTATTTTFSGFWAAMAAGNGTFVAVQGGASASTSFNYSTNGTSWVAGTLPLSSIYRTATWGNGYFFISGYSSTNACYSSNGITWTATTNSYAWRWTTTGFINNIFINLSDANSTLTSYSATAAILPVNFGIYNGPTTIN